VGRVPVSDTPILWNGFTGCTKAVRLIDSRRDPRIRRGIPRVLERVKPVIPAVPSGLCR
jgi:hypothetical protein